MKKDTLAKISSKIGIIVLSTMVVGTAIRMEKKATEAIDEKYADKDENKQDTDV